MLIVVKRIRRMRLKENLWIWRRMETLEYFQSESEIQVLRVKGGGRADILRHLVKNKGRRGSLEGFKLRAVWHCTCTPRQRAKRDW